jgi:predicted NAD/FAD-binding protein
MPRNPLTWSSWNYLTRTPDPTKSKSPSMVSLTYNMNTLQRIPVSTYGDVLITLNPPRPPARHLTQGTYCYFHPLYNAAAVQAQKDLQMIQNKRGISYCGAWTGYGFHEDGFTSGLKVAVEHLGAKVPFEVVDSTYSRGPRPRLRARHYLARLIIWVVQEFVLLWQWAWGLVIGIIPVAEVKSI